MRPRFFVLGPARSGTTLVTFVLSGQPDVLVVNDSFVYESFVEAWLQGFGPAPDASASWLRRLMSLLPRTRPSDLARGRVSMRSIAYRTVRRSIHQVGAGVQLSADEVEAYFLFLKSRYRREPGSFLASYEASLEPISGPVEVGSLLDRTVVGLARHFQGDVVAVGEKTPRHTLIWEWLRHLYPTRPFIVVLREPVANVASLTKRLGSFTAAIQRYGLYAEVLPGVLSDEMALAVRFEDLVFDPGRTVERMLSFLGDDLAFDPKCKVNAYTKSEYTGEVLDRRRAQLSDILSDRQEHAVRTRFSQINDMYHELDSGV